MKSMPDPQRVFANTVLIAPRLPHCSKHCLWLLWTLWPTEEMIFTLWCLTGKVRRVLLYTDVVFQWKLPEAVRPCWWESAGGSWGSSLGSSGPATPAASISAWRQAFFGPLYRLLHTQPQKQWWEPGPVQHPGSLKASKTPRTQVLKSPQAVTRAQDSVSREHAAFSLPSLSLHLILETHYCSSPTPSMLETATKPDWYQLRIFFLIWQTVEEYYYETIHDLLL